MTAAAAPSYVFQGRPVAMPVVVRDASSAAATFLVSAAAVRRLLPGPELEPLELLPGRALFSLAAIEYRDNDLDAYNEVSLAFFVRPRGAPRGLPYAGTLVDFLRGRAATYIWKLPVTQSFTCEAGRGIWGFPKTVEAIDFHDAGGRRTCRLAMHGRHVLTFTAPATGTRTLPDAPMVTYSYLGGRLHETLFTAGAREVGFALRGATLALGDHPVAGDLRSLGLPRAPLLTVWMGRQHGTFAAPIPVTVAGRADAGA